MRKHVLWASSMILQRLEFHSFHVQRYQKISCGLGTEELLCCCNGVYYTPENEVNHDLWAKGAYQKHVPICTISCKGKDHRRPPHDSRSMSTM